MTERRLTWRNVTAAFRWFGLRRRGVTGPLFFVDRRAEIELGPGADVHIATGVRIMSDFSGSFFGSVRIGARVFINRGGYIAAHQSVTIGADCLIGEYVSIHDANHDYLGAGATLAARGFTTAPVTIGSNVWIGAKATVLPGVTIGDGAVVGAGAVVTKDVPAGAVAVGVPARIVSQVEVRP